MFEADPNLERSITISKHTGKIPASQSKLHDKKANTVQTTLEKLLTKSKPSSLSVSTVLNYSVLNEY